MIRRTEASSAFEKVTRRTQASSAFGEVNRRDETFSGFEEVIRMLGNIALVLVEVTRRASSASFQRR